MDDELSSEPREPPPPSVVPWRPVEALPIAILSFVPLTVLATVVRLEGTAFLIGALLFEGMLAGFTILWVVLRYPGSIGLMRIAGSRPARDLVVGFGAGLGLFAFTVLVIAPILFGLLSLVAGEPVVPPQQPILPEDPTTAHVVIGGLMAVVGAPVGEEIFFRGFLHTSLRRRLRFPAAALTSGAAFALFHGIALLMPLMLVVGIGLAWVYERRGSLLASIAAHAAFNVVGYTFIVRNLGT